MRIILRFGGSLAGSGEGDRLVTLPSGASVRTVVERSGKEIPGIQRDPGTPVSRGSPAPIILLNGRNIEFLDGLDTLLVEGDVVSIFLASNGG